MIKEKDLVIISHLRENSRKHLTNISKNVKVPVSTLFDRLKVYERDVIKKYTSIVDFSKLGYSIRINLLMKARLIDSMKKHLSNNPNVNSLFLLSGRYNMLAECIFKDMGTMDDFINDLSAFGIDDKEIVHITEDVKREGFLNKAQI